MADEPLSRVEEILEGGNPSLLSRIEKLLKEGGAGGGVSPEQIAAAVAAYLDEHGIVIDVDSELSTTSEKPVQNKAIAAALQEHDVFIAENGVTTNAEIYAAFQAGKVVICVHNNDEYYLSGCKANSARFVCPVKSTGYVLSFSVSDNVWHADTPTRFAKTNDLSGYYTKPSGGIPASDLAEDVISAVTPEQYGAVGDGVADDTVPLQTAVSAGNVICTSGKTYLITKPIRFGNHIYDFGGSTIKMADGFEKNDTSIGEMTFGYVGLVFDGLTAFAVKNLVLDCNKTGNASNSISGAVLDSSTGEFHNCSFEAATYKHVVINKSNRLRFYSTGFYNLGAAANASDVYVTGDPISEVMFDGVKAERESGGTSTAQVFYINTGNVSVYHAIVKNCGTFTDSRSGSTIVEDAVIYNASDLQFIDHASSRANPANIAYKDVYFYDLYRSSGGYGVQVGGVSSLTIDNMYVKFAAGSTFSHALYFQSNYGKLNHDISINNLRMNIGNVAVQNALYFVGDDTTENVLLTNCRFQLGAMTRAYIARLANNPKNVRLENCVFDNFQFQWVYDNTNQHLLGVNNATPKRAATTDLPTLTTADTGSVILDTTTSEFKIWDGSAWVGFGGNKLPAVTASDNGKFLRVVNGAWAAESVPSAESNSFGGGS